VVLVKVSARIVMFQLLIKIKKIKRKERHERRQTRPPMCDDLVGPGPWSYEWLKGKCVPEVYHNDCNINSKGLCGSVLKEEGKLVTNLVR